MTDHFDEPRSTSRLLGLVTALGESDNLGAALSALLDRTMGAVGATHGGILQRATLDVLVRIRESRSSGLPEQMAIGDVRADLWAVLLGRSQLVWSHPHNAPSGLQDIKGWEQGVVLQIPGRRGETRLLALGSPDFSSSVDVTLLQGMLQVAAPTLDEMELSRATDRFTELLEGVTDLAGELGAAVSASQLVHAITQGLSHLEGISGAAVWMATDAHDLTPMLVDSAGPGAPPGGHSVEERVRRLLDASTSSTVRSLLSSGSRTATGSPLVTLMTLSTAPVRVLGVIHDHQLDDLSGGVLASLISAAAPAFRKVEIADERRTLLTGYTRALRPARRPAGLELAVEHHPNTSAPGSFGGDFYDWFSATPGHAVVALGDVSGKGINAASTASMVVWSLRAIAGQGAHPTVVAHLLNSFVDRELDVDKFVTLALVHIDTDSWEVEVLLAGHPPPLLIGTEDCSWVQAPASPPLGVAAVSSSSPTTIHLAPGEALVLYTDGVTEAIGPDDERYGPQRLLEGAQASVSAGPWDVDGLAAQLWDDVHAWAGGPPDDDCAIVVVRRPL